MYVIYKMEIKRKNFKTISKKYMDRFFFAIVIGKKVEGLSHERL